MNINTYTFKNKKHKIKLYYFVHIPKTGGSSLKKYLLDKSKKDKLMNKTLSQQNILIKGKKYFLRIISYGHKQAIEISPELYKFCILREPYSRFLSAFKYVKEGGKNNPFWGPEKYMFQKFKKFNINTPSDIFKLKNEYDKNKILNYVMFVPMYKYITDDKGNIIVDKIFILEKMNMKNLSSILEIDNIKLPKINKSEFKYELTTEDKHYIRQHYKKDFELYYKFLRKS